MADMLDVVTSWARIEVWLQKKAKRIYRSLAPGATDEQIAVCERQLGVTLPDDVRASFRIHNGAEESDLFPSSEPDDMAYSLLSLDEIAEAYSSMRTWPHWRDGWIPLTTNGGGDYQCIDLSADSPSQGQIIEAHHETGAVKVLARSWAARLSDLADGLEAKRYKYDADDGIIHPAPSDPLKELREAKRRMDEDRTHPPEPDDDRPAPTEYAEAVKLVDPDGSRFGRATVRRQAAMTWLKGSRAVTLYFRHSEPRTIFDLAGARFYPAPDALNLNELHWQPPPKDWPFVIATTVEGDHRLVLDTSSGSEYPPVLLVHRDVELKGRVLRQIKPNAKVIAPTLLEFWRRLAANALDFSP